MQHPAARLRSERSHRRHHCSASLIASTADRRWWRLGRLRPHPVERCSDRLDRAESGLTAGPLGVAAVDRCVRDNAGTHRTRAAPGHGGEARSGARSEVSARPAQMKAAMRRQRGCAFMLIPDSDGYPPMWGYFSGGTCGGVATWTCLVTPSDYSACSRSTPVPRVPVVGAQLVVERPRTPAMGGLRRRRCGDPPRGLLRAAA
jgi:hypothetical protein